MLEPEIDFKKLKVLLADDHAFIRNLIKGMLSQAGASNIIVADSGREVLEVLKQQGNAIDCIISDWNMPPPGGLELLRSIRMGTFREIRANLPFIMLTGHASSTVVTAALQLDVNAYVVKPASSAKLMDAIRKALTKPLTAKAPAHYRAVAEIDLPDQEEEPDRENWAQWVKSGQPAILSTNSQFISRKSVDTSAGPQPDNPDQLHNVRFKKLEKIKVGVVLAEDFLGTDGKPLISAGTVLNQKLLDRLNAFQTTHGAEVRLWVGTRQR